MQSSEHSRREQTRQRLLSAATNVFAEHGYGGATTRDICARAKANSAAVNYHFGDKLGLYTEVLKMLIAVERKLDLEQVVADAPPEIALRQFIEIMFRNVGCGDAKTVYTRLMMHELAQPTAGLELVVRQFIQPRADRLRAIVGKIIAEPVDSDRTRLCAHSIIGQLVYYFHARPVIMLLWPKWRLDDAMRQQMIEHFTHFSLAALQHLNDSPAASGPRRRGGRRPV